jgi:hypothetical protein
MRDAKSALAAVETPSSRDTMSKREDIAAHLYCRAEITGDTLLRDAALHIERLEDRLFDAELELELERMMRARTVEPL